MKKFNFYNGGQSLVGIIIVLVVVSLITGGLYLYFSKQIPKVPETSKEITETETVSPKEEAEEKLIPSGKEESREPAFSKCTDGTPYGQCSSNKPKYCNNGDLVNKCSTCGCLSGQQCAITGNCVILVTITRYYDVCWDYDCSAKYPPYPKLSESQKPNNLRVFRYLKATGIVDILVIFLYAHDLLPEEKINILKRPESDGSSLRYVAKWYKDEAEKYGVNLDIRIDFSETQSKVPEEYIIRSYEESFRNYLTEYVKRNFSRVKDYDIFVPLYYDSSFISFANHVSGENSFEIFATQPFPGSFTLPNPRTFAHELSHLFGASDKYTCLEVAASSESCVYAKENGYGCWIESENPAELGRDIMCHRVPDYYSSGEWVFGQPSLKKEAAPSNPFPSGSGGLVIIEATAKEIGWYDADDDGVLEINDPCPFNRLNDCF